MRRPPTMLDQVWAERWDRMSDTVRADVRWMEARETPTERLYRRVCHVIVSTRWQAMCGMPPEWHAERRRLEAVSAYLQRRLDRMKIDY